MKISIIDHFLITKLKKKEHVSQATCDRVHIILLYFVVYATDGSRCMIHCGEKGSGARYSAGNYNSYLPRNVDVLTFCSS